MANTKSKKAANKKSSTKPKTTTAAKTEKTVKAPVVTKETNTVEITAKSGNPLAGFFAKKCDTNENILTIFKSWKIVGAIAGEVVGTMLLSILLLTLGVYQPLYVMFGILAITIAVFAFSGAHLNPIITVGMMATRRVSAIRGVIYLISQVVGAWLGLVIVSAFVGAGGMEAQLPAMAAVADGKFWLITMIEFMGATIIGFFFARAMSYKRSAFTFAAIVAGGVTLAMLFCIIVSSNFAGLQNNFILNPAVAIMYQIFPASAEGFGELMSGIIGAGLMYIIFPMIGGVAGFFLSDLASKFSNEQIRQ